MINLNMVMTHSKISHSYRKIYTGILMAITMFGYLIAIISECGQER